MKLLLLLITFTIPTCILNCQTPGYMGKRFSAGYGFHFGPALLGSNGNGKSIFGRNNGNAKDGEFAFNRLHEVYIEYAIKTRFSIGTSAIFYKTTYDNGMEFTANVNRNSPQGTYIYGQPSNLYTIKGVNYLVYGKLFYGKYIAPWGRYMCFGINIRSYTASYNPNKMSFTYNSYINNINENITFSDFGPLKQHYTKFDIFAGFGRTRILADKIIFDYGFNTNMYSLLTTLFDAGGPQNFIDEPDNTIYIKKTSAFRVRNLNRFNVFIKVGYLF